MHYTDQDVEKLVKAVEAEFTSHLAKAEENFRLAKSESVSASLAKAEEGEKKPEKKPEGEEKKDSAPPQEAAPEGEKKPEGEAPAQAAPAAPAEGAPAGEPAAVAGPYDAEDIQHLDKMYMSMSKDELMIHHDAVRKALDSGAAQAAPAPGAAPAAPMAKDESITASAPKGPLGARSEASKEQGPYAKEGLKKDELIKPSEPKGSPGAKDAASDAHGDKINVGLKKTEHSRENGGKIEASNPKGSPGAKAPATKEQDKVGKEVSMEKSENTALELLKTELAAEKAKTESLQKNLDGVSAFITKLLEKRVAPQGKAITSLEPIAKSEGGKEAVELSKEQIDAVLNKKAQDPKLEKSDRDAINSYCLNGKTDIDSIRHLLK